MQNQYYRLLYHVTWSTRCRTPIIDNEIKQPLLEYLRSKALSLGGTTLAVGGVDDHVHLILSIPPQAPFATFIGRRQTERRKFALGQPYS